MVKMLSILLVWTLPIVLAMATVAKLARAVDFASALSTFSLMPGWALDIAKITVPAIELLPLVLMCCSLGVWANGLATGQVIAYSLVIGWHRINDVKPTCGCFGEWTAFFQRQAWASDAIVRNAILVAIGTVAIFVARRMSRTSISATRSPAIRKRGATHFPAFTLIEVLVVVAVIALVVALSLTGLSGARSAARNSRILSDLRSHAQAFAAYSSDHKSLLPLFTKPGSRSTDLRGGGIEILGIAYFDSFQTWHIPLSEAHYSLPATSDTFFPPNFRSVDASPWPLYTPYAYPCVFIADPAYWNPLTRIGVEQFRATRLDEVAFPSSKSQFVLTRIERPGITAYSTNYPASFCDGSSGSPKGDDILSGYEYGDSRADVRSGAVHFGAGPPMMHTIDGVRGRDVQARR